MHPYLAIILVTIIASVVLLSAVRIARKVQQGVDKLKQRQKPNEESPTNRLIGHLHGLWAFVAGGIGGFKHVYKAWHNAPPGSPAKFGWGILLSAIFAVIGWLAIVYVDKKLNGPRQTSSLS